MTSREKILAALRANQPEGTSLPTEPQPRKIIQPVDELFIQVLQSIGGSVTNLSSRDKISEHLSYPTGARVVTTVESFTFAEQIKEGMAPHSYQNVHTAIIEGIFGVAENGAIWVTEEQIKVRALPFICEHLVILLDRKDIVATMHDAYQRIGHAPYPFGVFIAGPSKTADIEQSLVLGAHGSRTLTVFLTA